MDITQLVTQMAQQFISDTNNDGKVDINDALGSLTGLLSAGGSSGSSLDLGSLVSKMQGSDLADLAASWLGDGDNLAMSGQQVNDVLGPDKVSEFASKMNMDQQSAQDGLAKMLPQLIDKSSSGGQLNDLINAAGGLSGITDAVGKLFSK